MRALVTGAAGFIGSHLCEALVAAGWDVTGVDGFTGNYESNVKRRNLSALARSPRFRLVEADLLEADLNRLLDGVTHLFHLAGEPGVRSCWGDRFRIYAERNLLVTQALLEACRARRPERFLLASTSAVYGLAEALPTPESTVPQPVSPYGVTKHAAEQMVRLYEANFGLEATILRFFTVYGPRQRPDMAFHKFLHAILTGREITIYGDGSQTRDFTYVGDMVPAVIAAATAPAAGRTLNLGAGRPVSVNQVLEVMEQVTGLRPSIRYEPVGAGEMAHTAADIKLARHLLGFDPQTGLRDGLAAQYEWQKGCDQE